MAIIGIGGEKGGCGKSTIAVNIAAALAHAKKSVVLLDADKKPTASKWAEKRAARDDLPRVYCKRVVGDIDDSLKLLSKEYDYVIVDCGGMAGREMRYSLAYGNVFISPFQPSRFDLESLEGVSDAVLQVEPINPSLRAYSLINRASNNARSVSNKNTIEALQGPEAKGLTLLEPVIHDLEVWRRCGETGKCVIELDNEKAQQDLFKLINSLEIL